MAVYVPRVIVCGSVEDFRKEIGNKPVEIVGQIDFDDMKNFHRDAAEYLIYTDAFKFYNYLFKTKYNTRVMSSAAFAKKVQENFFSVEMLIILKSALTAKKFSGRVLDFDALFAKSGFRTSGVNFEVKLDCVAENIYPIMENVYGKIYRTFDECKFHTFDALILYKERTPAEFIDVLIKTDSLTENIFVFARKDTALEKFLAANENLFAKVERLDTDCGAWYYLKKFMPPADVAMYVVTHKDAKLATLPEGYKFIHAGRKEDLGYLGDDTGDNISELNPFLDETTALYWIWKNTRHTHAGLCHYRRFFTTANQNNFDAEKILSTEEILKILNEYDIITKREGMAEHEQFATMILSTGQPDLVNIVYKIVRDHLAKAQPAYLDAFDDMFNNFALFACGMFITRREIFNAYCEWLFSFIIDATRFVRDKLRIEGKTLEETGHAYSRIVGFSLNEC